MINWWPTQDIKAKIHCLIFKLSSLWVRKIHLWKLGVSRNGIPVPTPWETKRIGLYNFFNLSFHSSHKMVESLLWYRITFHDEFSSHVFHALPLYISYGVVISSIWHDTRCVNFWMHVILITIPDEQQYK